MARDVNGALLALGVVGAVTAAGAVMGGRGSMSRVYRNPNPTVRWRPDRDDAPGYYVIDALSEEVMHGPYRTEEQAQEGAVRIREYYKRDPRYGSIHDFYTKEYLYPASKLDLEVT